MSGNKKQQSVSNTETLRDILLRKLFLEQELYDTGGELTKELELLWESTDIELKDKIDSYGYVLDNLVGEREKLKAAKTQVVSRVSAALDRLDRTEDSMKRVLHKLSDGESLRGRLYSFHPFMSKTSQIRDLDLVDKKQVTITVELNQKDWEDLIEGRNINYAIKKRTTRIKDLPINHPAIETKVTPSVRVT